MNIEPLTIEDLKVIRIALTRVPLSTPLLTAVKNVDAVLAQHGLKCESKAKPRRPYQRRAEIEYVFESIVK